MAKSLPSNNRQPVHSRRAWPTIAFAMLAIALLTGCKDRVSISGQVSHGGKPIPAGDIQFESQGKVFTAPISAGRYAMNETVSDLMSPGMYQVAIIPPTIPFVDDPITGKRTAQGSIDESLYPMKFRSTQTSGLQCELKAGPNVMDFN